MESAVDDIPILHQSILDGFISPVIYLELIIRLLKVGADPHVRNVHGITPMHLSYPVNYRGVKYGYGDALQAASHSSHEEIVKRLPEIEVDINKWDENFNSVLQTASYAGLEKVVKQLLDAGVIIDENSKTYRGALRAALYGSHEKMVKQLVDKGAGINGGEKLTITH